MVISGHYDVEEAETPPSFCGPAKTGENVPSDIWQTDPFVPEICDGRVAARGIIDKYRLWMLERYSYIPSLHMGLVA